MAVPAAGLAGIAAWDDVLSMWLYPVHHEQRLLIRLACRSEPLCGPGTPQGTAAVQQALRECQQSVLGPAVASAPCGARRRGSAVISGGL